MTLKEQLKLDLKTAMRQKDILKRDTIRSINTMIKQIEVDERKVLNDSDILKLIQKGIKQRNEAAQAYKNASRNDLEKIELDQIEIFNHYLPKQLDDIQLELKTKEIIDKTQATSLKDMGKIMALASKEFDGIASGSRISQMVKKLLN
jgi:uncharacterized protein